MTPRRWLVDPWAALSPVSLALAVIGSIAIGLPTPASAGTLHAQITLAPEHADPPDGLWRVDNGVLPVAPRPVDLHGESVVVLVPRGGGKPARKDEVVTATLRGLRLSPSVIVVPLGASLELKNEDRVPHVIGGSDDVLPPRPIPAGASRTERLPRPGVYALADDDLPHLRGWVIVAEGGLALRPDEHGAIHAEVPDGAYTLKLFARGAVVVTRDLEVGPHTAELSLTVPARTRPAGAAEGAAR